MNVKKIRVRDVLEFFDENDISYEFSGDSNCDLSGYSSIYQYRPGTISWLRNTSILGDIKQLFPNSMTCIITPYEIPKLDEVQCQVWVKNPKEVFFDVLDKFWGKSTSASISSLALIEDGAVIGKDVQIGPFSHVSSQAIIGDRTRIGSNVTIKGKVHIGEDCVIQSGAVLGEDGFAFIRNGETQKFVKHYGGVVLENHVSIGSQTCICRGAIEDTYIGEYTKIDNLCHIAHNVIIGKRTIVVCLSAIMGSVRIGDDCWVATSMIRDQRRIGNDSVIGMGSVVVKNVPNGVTVVGSPAKQFKRKEEL